jgi:coiled-coil domain-containing protein 12
MSLSAEAEKRKERLLALKKRKRGQLDDSEDPLEPLSIRSPPPHNDEPPPQNNSSVTQALPLSGRNYDPTTRTTKLGFQENPLASLPQDFETVEEVAINLAIEAITQAEQQKGTEEGGEVDLFSLQPKRANWDLKRDLEKKVERLKPRTDRAIARLVRERLGGKKGEEEVGEGDLARVVEMRERREREEEMEDV